MRLMYGVAVGGLCNGTHAQFHPPYPGHHQCVEFCAIGRLPPGCKLVVRPDEKGLSGRSTRNWIRSADRAWWNGDPSSRIDEHCRISCTFDCITGAWRYTADSASNSRHTTTGFTGAWRYTAGSVSNSLKAGFG